MTTIFTPDFGSQGTADFSAGRASPDFANSNTGVPKGNFESCYTTMLQHRSIMVAISIVVIIIVIIIIIIVMIVITVIPSFRHSVIPYHHASASSFTLYHRDPIGTNLIAAITNTIAMTA